MTQSLGAVTAWTLVLAFLVVRRCRRRRAAGRPLIGVTAMGRRTSFALVVAIIAATVFLPVVVGGTSFAYADGYDCKEAPNAEIGNSWGDFFDPDAETAARADGSDYGTYGWGGLKFATYDLGCGPDLTRAPGAVFDTSAGNFGLNVSKALAGMAIWLDRQTRTEYQSGGGATSVLAKFDTLVREGSAALKSAFYDQWIGVSLLVLGIMVLGAAFRGRGATVMRATLVGGAALFLAAVAIGAPQSATKAVDQQFTGTIGDVQSRAMKQIGVDPVTGPRDVVIDDIIEREWRAGWFGDPDSPIAAANAPKLRAALALSYSDQDKLDQIKNTRATGGLYPPTSYGRYLAAYTEIQGPKKKAFEQVATTMGDDSSDAYGQFIGKDSGRMNAGFIAAVETFSATALWISASLLKLLGLLIIRLAILFAPIWVPLVMVSERLLMTIVRFIGSALFWAVAASAAVAAHLIVMVKLFSPDLGLGTGWRVFMLVIVTAVIWMVLRPFKRLTQFAGMNVNATARGALHHGRRAGAGALALAGAGGAAAGAGVGWAAGKHSGNSDGNPDRGGPTLVAQEGRMRRARPPGPATAELVGIPARPALTAPPAGTPSRVVGRTPRQLTGSDPGSSAPAIGPPLSPLPPASSRTGTWRPSPADIDILTGDAPLPDQSRPVRAAPAFQRDGEIVYDLYTPSTGAFTHPRPRSGDDDDEFERV